MAPLAHLGAHEAGKVLCGGVGAGAGGAQGQLATAQALPGAAARIRPVQQPLLLLLLLLDRLMGRQELLEAGAALVGALSLQLLPCGAAVVRRVQRAYTSRRNGRGA